MLTPSEDETFIVDTVTRFAKARVAPAAPRWDRAAAFPADLGPDLAELGLLGLLVDAERGGTDVEPSAALFAIRALAREDAALAWVVASHNLGLHLVGDALDAGPALAGQSWITTVGPVPAPAGAEVCALGASPEHIVAMASGAPAIRPRDRASATPVEPALGLRAAGLAHVGGPGLPTFDAADRSPSLMMATAVALGVGAAALDAALAYAREREQFGRPIGDFQGLQFRLADRATELDAAEVLLRWCAVDPDPRRAREAALLGARGARAAAYDAVQIFGGVGFVREYPVEKHLRDAQTLEGFLLRPGRLRAELAG